jgi:hypothetical protein
MHEDDACRLMTGWSRAFASLVAGAPGSGATAAGSTGGKRLELDITGGPSRAKIRYSTVYYEVTFRPRPSKELDLQSSTATASISTSNSGNASAATPTKVLAGGVLLAKKRRLHLADNGSMLRSIVHHISRDFRDVVVARTGCGEGQTDIAHRLGCLGGDVTGTD